MTRIRRALGVVLLSGTLLTAWFVGDHFVRDHRVALAEQQVQVTPQQLASVEDLASVFREVGKAVEPSVVSIRARHAVRGMHRDIPFDEELFRRFFPDRELPETMPPIPDEFHRIGTGSGVIMETDGSVGYILTNYHVAAEAEELLITLHDGRQLRNSELVGADAKTDLALIRIEAGNLVSARWGDSDKLQKGDWVLAFGSPFGYVGSMTHGIVSAMNRTVGILGQLGYEDFIQVDAAINPGNSGGPLVNIRGELVGINTAIATRNGGFQGIGFAIPSTNARFVYDQLKQRGRVVRGWLGVTIASVSDVPELARSFGYEQTAGVFVQEIHPDPDTPAHGHLREGDIITAVNGKPVPDAQALRNLIAITGPDTEVAITVFRDEKSQDVKLRLGEQPEDLRVATRQGRGRGEVETPGQLGLRLSDVTDEHVQRFNLDERIGGAIITHVEPRSAGARVGLRPGYVITRVGNKGVSSAAEARDELAKHDVARGVRLYVRTPEGARFVFIRVEE